MKRNDLILAGAILAVAAVILAFQFFRQGNGEQLVEISVDGEVFGTYDLTDDQTIKIGNTNRVVIEDGAARMEWADCPDQICVNHRAVSKNGESIICLPNQVVVTVVSSEESGLDAVAQYKGKEIEKQSGIFRSIYSSCTDLQLYRDTDPDPVRSSGYQTWSGKSDYCDCPV